MRVLPLLGVTGSVECYGDEQGAADGDRRFLLFLSVSALFAIARGNQVGGVGGGFRDEQGAADEDDFSC